MEDEAFGRERGAGGRKRRDLEADTEGNRREQTDGNRSRGVES